MVGWEIERNERSDNGARCCRCGMSQGLLGHHSLAVPRPRFVPRPRGHSPVAAPRHSAPPRDAPSPVPTRPRERANPLPTHDAQDLAPAYALTLSVRARRVEHERWVDGTERVASAKNATPNANMSLCLAFVSMASSAGSWR